MMEPPRHTHSEPPRDGDLPAERRPDPPTARALLADDHPAFRAGLRAMLKTLPNVTVVGDADTGLRAVAQASAMHPSLVIMDLHMPELDGIEATRRISAADPSIAVLILTMYQDDD